MSPNLRIPVTIGIGESARNKIVDTFNTVEAVEEELHTQGIHERPKPAYECPEVSETDLTTVSYDQYSALYARLLGWYNYVQMPFAKVKSRVLEYENMLDRIAATIRTDLKATNRQFGKKSEKLSESEIKDAILLDPNHTMISLELQKYQQHRIQIEAFMEMVSHSMKVVSRQIEIKKIEFEGSNRDANNQRQPFTHPRFAGGSSR
jgi:hypothetical protein